MKKTLSDVLDAKYGRLAFSASGDSCKKITEYIASHTSEVPELTVHSIL